MTELQASRTLVKSPPELWAECSDAASLARHLDGFGEIRITRLEPETAVAWEGERARGTVRIEPAGWGTKVILTAMADPSAPEAAAPPVIEIAADAPAPPDELQPPDESAPPDESVPPDEPAPPDEPVPPVRKRRFARLRAYWRGERLSVPEPPVEEPSAAIEMEEPPAAIEIEEPPVGATPAPDMEPLQPEVSDAEAALAAALDSLGQAHHRPYSRA